MDSAGRAGSVKVNCDGFLIVEGIGAARHELADLATLVIWVNTDPDVAYDRMISRDIDLGVNGETRADVEAFANGYLELEVPFQLTERPWERADLIVDGASMGPDNVVKALTPGALWDY